ncbi:MAG TPA: OmpA family protein [Holophagaceae bacterium]|nr:OmpA family protein [Holophagaceae bacterium]
MPLPFLLVPALVAPPQAPKPLPFAFQASKAYGDPDRFEDRPFDQYEFRAKDGKGFKKEGRYYFRQWHYRKDSGEEKPSALWVYRNAKNALQGAGAEILWDNQTNTFYARAETNGKTLWIRLDGGSDWWEMFVIQEEPMVQAFSADLLTQSLAKDGFATLDVHFATNSAEILPESLPVVDGAAAVLKAHPDWKISVEGHTDATGDAASNMGLSVQRARSVMAALAQRGVPAANLGAAGFGGERPVADNRTEAGRAKNRRVELVKR